MTNATWRQNFKVGQSLPFLPFSVFRIGGLNNSVILTSLDYNNYTGKLLSYLEPVLLSSKWSRFVKCWHAKTDGWAASTFHSNCDGRGPTVTIIKVKDYIFGGYTDVSWSSKYILATKFFFSVQGLKDLEGRRINVGRIWCSLVPKIEKKMSPEACFLKFLETLRAQSHILLFKSIQSGFVSWYYHRLNFKTIHNSTLNVKTANEKPLFVAGPWSYTGLILGCISAFLL